MGLDGLSWVERHVGYGAIAVTADGRLVWSESAAPRLAGDLSRASHGQALS
jgi:hypothetical protein